MRGSRINGYIGEFKSSFLSCEKDTETIIKKLFVDSKPYSDMLKRLLLINTPDCLNDMTNPVYLKKIKETSIQDLKEQGYLRFGPKLTLGENEEVKSFIGEYIPDEYLLDESKNISMGPLALQKDFYEKRKELADAMVISKDIIKEVSEEFYKITGRKYDLYEKYMLDDAEIGIVVLNSTAGTTKDVIDDLRAKGIKAGMLKPRAFRPLPWNEISLELKELKALAILDKADSVNAYSGPLFSEITSAMYSSRVYVPTINYIYGLGGVDVKTDDILKVFEKLENMSKTYRSDKTTYYLGLDD